MFGLMYINGYALFFWKFFNLVLNFLYYVSYDHPNILAGQGTMALEIIQEVPDVDAIIVPTGGGGLLAGIATAAKSMSNALF